MTSRLRTPVATGNDADAAIPATTVVLVVFDGVEALDVAGPASVFAKAAAMQPADIVVRIASPRGGTVTTNAAIGLAGTEPLGAIDDPVDTLLVAGGDEPAVRRAIAEDGIGAWLTAIAPRVRRIGSVCSGAFALAAAGLLDGRAATTHWRYCEMLERVRPGVRVLRDRIHVRDGRIWTSAGVTTGIELALAMVEEDLGRPVAMEIARTLALPLLRGAEQPQLSPTLRAQADASDRLRDVLAWIATHLDQDLSVEALAARARMSPRHFARAFVAQTGATPAKFVSQARLDAAMRLLRQTRWTQERIASRSGFGSVDALQRAFAKRRATTPRRCR